MIEVGNVMLAAMDATSDRDNGVAALHALYEPKGEYMLAVVPVLMNWLANRTACSKPNSPGMATRYYWLTHSVTRYW